MRELMPYDCQGVDGSENKKAFESLPSCLRLAIKEAQNTINQAVRAANSGRKIQSTSGFRAPTVNTRVGGVVNSLHLWGFARDFRFFADEPEPFKVPDFLECIKSKGCWHAQYKRGV